ncbi:50S ribosomal protein L11 methyltransferase [Jeotgalicoccus meleagridis]|uniref:Ribosomal protein L11 methyltransferase n=1 Tax=Jeotgalicoccus meleagridis TaxID=2759181 RepID=A0A6V7RJJ5_9STAP|nr:50S ribosomal protein L11 methyltransferase [Jeotgalicoccus meleagridis]CAD2078293.1 Ribosomal protein L11 methyltransferase [Jeotgalicoccus meleagridis]
MKWHEVTISSNVDNEEVLTSFLNTIAKGVAIEYSVDTLRSDIDDFDAKFRLNPEDYPESGLRLIVYFDETMDIDEKLRQIETFIANNDLVDREQITISKNIIDEEDWENEWKKHFHNFKVGRNFFIVPSWEFDQVAVSESDKVIKIDPGMAFGTGDHATTSLCLTLMEDIIEDHQKVIDVGTGSGILSIGAHLLGARSIKATDIDELSLKVATENIKLNDCSEDITVEKGDLLKDENDQYDVVIANILAHIIDDMITDAYSHLNNDGYFISSGIIVEKKDEIINHLEAVGFQVQETLVEDGWVAILSKKVI